jgi:putative two-component system response regulator
MTYELNGQIISRTQGGNLMQILVVDDDPVSLEITSYVLQEDGHEIVPAANGREALEILAEGRCRIVISDWIMPEVNGLTLCRSIRQGEYSSYIYIILLTTLAEREDAIAGLSAGADDFMTKPVDAAELRARIRAAERVLALETRDLTIFSLATAVESRDGLSGNHLERLRRYTRTLGEYLAGQPRFREQINGEFLRLLYMTSPLHDIGKLAIDDAVLLKPGRLTAEEFEVMKTHAQKGAEILESALKQNPDADFLRMARDIAITHHERYDGTGYPAGLAEEAIPLAGRIVAVADVYDALTSHRVYKAAISHQQARKLIASGSGTQFDPGVVEAFLATEAQFLSIRERFPDEAGVCV